ncbi:hypothetical protein AK812_SmicGene3606 [Symbiodinium microadriaticum]|uniref:Uncharacterized protein n=1 Tax=Symbiodinium microadriaticum TaxID=2951 RepID=A0A1Q9EYK1_SYMMI|nr:hypothetical protein AK812_SmicGene3606 [Symbiodinium microadriaticum]
MNCMELIAPRKKTAWTYSPLQHMRPGGEDHQRMDREPAEGEDGIGDSLWVFVGRQADVVDAASTFQLRG